MSIANRILTEDGIQLVKFSNHCWDLLESEDSMLYGLLSKEYKRQQSTLAMVASCSPTHPSVLACEGSFTSNVTAEGYPGARFHAGCEFVDQFEQLAIDRAKNAFRARYANVQPHTASIANQIVLSSLLKPGDTLLGLDLDCGGHLSHGSSVNLSGQFFQAISYGLDKDGMIDYEQVSALADKHKPKLIICGTTAYPRVIEWGRFRDIADGVNAYLLADITHIAGLVITGQHPSPIDIAHITTTCTHKQLYGPRGGLILMGKECESPKREGKGTLKNAMQRGTFPLVQGAPIVNNIVAKARALGRSMTPEFRQLAGNITVLARRLAAVFGDYGVRVMSGGTDNHIVVVDVLTSFGITGVVAEMALEQCGVIVNKNRITGDSKGVRVTSGIRLGTNGLAARGFSKEDVDECAILICKVLSTVKQESDTTYVLDESSCEMFRDHTAELCAKNPISAYPVC